MCIPLVTRPPHLQRSGESSAISSLRVWGEQRPPPGGFLPPGDAASAEEPPEPAHLSAPLSRCLPRNLLRIARKTTGKIPLTATASVGLPPPGACLGEGLGAAQHPWVLHGAAGPNPLTLPKAFVALTGGGWDVPPNLAQRWHRACAQGLGTHPCQEPGTRHSRSSASSHCSGRRGGHLPPGCSTSRTASAPGLGARIKEIRRGEEWGRALTAALSHAAPVDRLARGLK